jgi:crotonobetainyl-CoA:carnitine CoA-transferase CaiB-like acyl-CoA transferase
MSGVTRYVGTLGEAPVRLGADVASVYGGCAGAQAVLAALLERLDSGIGQRAEVSQLGAIFAGLTVMIAALDDPDVWEGFHCLAATGPRDHGIRTRDGVMMYGQPLRSEEPWHEFCHIIGADALLSDPRFATRQHRQPRIAELRRELQPYFERFDTADLIRIITQTEGIGVPFHNFSTLFAHPQVQAMEVLVEADDGAKVVRAPWRFGRSTVNTTLPASGPAGRDTLTALAELGLPDAEVTRLLACGQIFQARSATDSAKV